MSARSTCSPRPRRSTARVIDPTALPCSELAASKFQIVDQRLESDDIADASKCVIFEGFGNGCAHYSSNTASMFAGELEMAPPPGTLLSSLTLNSKGAARRRTAVSARG